MKNEEPSPYKNPQLSPRERALDLLSRMTLEEKVAQTHCLWFGKAAILKSGGDLDHSKAQKLLPHGLGELARLNENAGINSEGFSPRRAAERYNNIQRYFIEETRLGIPVMVHEESLHGQQTKDATNFPTPIALASSWNELLMAEVFTHVADEVRARGGQHVLAPVVDIARDPRWGRTEETMGEDPFLVSRLTVAQVKAYQGDSEYLPNNKVAATLKHFGIHGQSEGGINTAPSNLDERTGREIFFPAFKAAIQEAKVMAVMPTYNEVWGLPAHMNKKLLKDILRDEWGFEGLVISDYIGILELTKLHRITPNIDEAGALAFNAGVDIEAPDIDGFRNLHQHVLSGRISEKDLDTTVLRILIQKFRLRLFDDPYVDPDAAERIVGSEEKRKAAYKAATESMVLLKNDHNFLPLDKKKVKRIAFIGPNADKCLLGAYSGRPKFCVSPLQAMKERYGTDIEILYAEGIRLTNKNDWFADEIHLVSRKENDKRITEAVDVAKRADVIVLFVGGNESMNREGWNDYHLGDLPTLELLNGQVELIKEIAALKKPSCAFVNSGPPLSIGPLTDSVSALMQCWYLGQEGGYAMVDALFGDVNPSGKLPITFPRTVGHIPAYYNHKPTARRGYHLGFEVSPLFPFGHGLSYTKFKYGKPRLASDSIVSSGTTEVSIEVTNTGRREGGEVVQLYIRDEYASVPRPVKELKGFEKIWLRPGESATVSFSINSDLLAFYNADMKWVVEPGEFTIMIGGSSVETQDIKLTVHQ